MDNMTTLEMLEDLLLNSSNKYRCDFGIVEMQNGDVRWYHSKMLFSLAHENLSARWSKYNGKGI